MSGPVLGLEAALARVDREDGVAAVEAGRRTTRQPPARRAWRRQLGDQCTPRSPRRTKRPPPPARRPRGASSSRAAGAARSRRWCRAGWTPPSRPAWARAASSQKPGAAIWASSPASSAHLVVDVQEAAGIAMRAPAALEFLGDCPSVPSSQFFSGRAGRARGRRGGGARGRACGRPHGEGPTGPCRGTSCTSGRCRRGTGRCGPRWRRGRPCPSRRSGGLDGGRAAEARRPAAATGARRRVTRSSAPPERSPRGSSSSSCAQAGRPARRQGPRGRRACPARHLEAQQACAGSRRTWTRVRRWKAA